VPLDYLGIKRDDGRIATRNYIGVISCVNCSATAANLVQALNQPGRMRPRQTIAGHGRVAYFRSAIAAPKFM
jgi:altronate hydrolase